VGTDADREETRVHNARFTDQAQNTQILNDNVTQWLKGTVVIPDDPEHTRRPDTYSVQARYLRCLFAPNYTVFSNTASQNQWIKDRGQDPSSHYVVSLESPHNAIHLAVGGFYQAGVYNAAPIRGANGDMGDNETAGFDPIFYFHHCFIDYTFAIWQRLWGRTQRGSLEIINGYPGTVLGEGEGQPPKFPPGTHVDLSIPLYPFKKTNGADYTSIDATDISELGYSYGVGSLDPVIPRGIELSERTGKTIFDTISHGVDDPMKIIGHDPSVPTPFAVIKKVHNISRAQYDSSFVIRLYARGHNGEEVEVGREAILSRWNLKGCANCQNNLNVETFVPIDSETLKRLAGPGKAEVAWVVKVHTRDGTIHEPLAGIPTRGGERVPIVSDL